jgi:hypothetical protein
VFYLNGKLHKILRIDKPKDLVECYIFSEQKRVLYAWTAVRKNRRPVFTRRDVAEFFNRHPVVISRYINSEKIPAPQKSHELTTKAPGDYYWSEEDILRLHDYLLTVHKGHPRDDGLITNYRLPSRAELISMMRTGSNIYVQSADGKFVPMWRAEEW